MEQHALPLGFGMALAMDPAAMERFAAMSEKEKQKVLEQARRAGSKREMRQLVSGLGDGSAQASD